MEVWQKGISETLLAYLNKDFEVQQVPSALVMQNENPLD
jgi:hypothetical protein